MPDDKEGDALLKKAQKADEEEDSAYRKAMHKKAERSRMAQLQSPPVLRGDKPSATMESVEEAVKERKAQFRYRPDYYDPPEEKEEFTTDIRTGMKRRKSHLISDPTWGWDDADYKEEKKLVGEVMKAYDDARPSGGYEKAAMEGGYEALRDVGRMSPEEGTEHLRSSWRSGRPYKGGMDDIRRYNRPQTPEKMAQNDALIVNRNQAFLNKHDYRTYLKLLADKFKDKASEAEAGRSTAKQRIGLRMPRSIHESREKK